MLLQNHNTAQTFCAMLSWRSQVKTKYFVGDYMSHAFSFELYNVVFQRCWVKWFRRLQCYSRALWDSACCDISVSAQAAAKPLCSTLTYISCSLVFHVPEGENSNVCTVACGFYCMQKKNCGLLLDSNSVCLLPHGQKCILSVLIMFCYFVRMFQECGARICCLFGCPL